MPRPLASHRHTAPGGVTFLRARKILTDEQVEDLMTNGSDADPIQMVPAPGAGKYLCVHRVVVTREVLEEYVAVDEGQGVASIGLFYEGRYGSSVSSGEVTAEFRADSISTITESDLAEVANKGLVLWNSADEASGNRAASGSSTNHRVVVFYTIEDI